VSACFHGVQQWHEEANRPEFLRLIAAHRRAQQDPCNRKASPTCWVRAMRSVLLARLQCRRSYGQNGETNSRPVCLFASLSDTRSLSQMSVSFAVRSSALPKAGLCLASVRRLVAWAYRVRICCTTSTFAPTLAGSRARRSAGPPDSPACARVRLTSARAPLPAPGP